MKIVTPQSIIRNLKNRMDKLRAEGKEPTVENLNAEAIKAFKKRLKEDNNG